MHSSVQSQRARLVGPDEDKARQQLTQRLQADRIKTEKTGNDGGGCATASVMDHIAVGARDFAKTFCPGAWRVAQGVSAARRDEETVSAGKRKKIGHALHFQPAIAARDHAEMCQFGGGNAMPRRSLSFGLFGGTSQAPGCGGFQARRNDGSNVHGLEDIGDWIQLTLPNWTIGHEIRTAGQFKSRIPDIYSPDSM